MKLVQHFYMKALILWLSDAKRIQNFDRLIKELADYGIGTFVFREDSSEEMRSAKDALYVTDSGAHAAALMAKGLAVMAYLHEDNRAESFAGILYGCEAPEEIGAVFLDRAYRRYRGIPWEILETARCRLRETTVEDVDAFVEIYSAPGITRYTEALYEDPDQEKAYLREYIEKIYTYYEYGVWTVLDRETGEIIGRAGFSERAGYDLPELGFVIATPHQGKGIATEICRAILEYGAEYLDFQQVQSLVRPENEISLALCKRLGFTERGRVLEEDHVTGIRHEYCQLIWSR